MTSKVLAPTTASVQKDQKSHETAASKEDLKACTGSGNEEPTNASFAGSQQPHIANNKGSKATTTSLAPGGAPLKLDVNSEQLLNGSKTGCTAVLNDQEPVVEATSAPKMQTSLKELRKLARKPGSR